MYCAVHSPCPGGEREKGCGNKSCTRKHCGIFLASLKHGKEWIGSNFQSITKKPPVVWGFNHKVALFISIFS